MSFKFRKKRLSIISLIIVFILNIMYSANAIALDIPIQSEPEGLKIKDGDSIGFNQSDLYYFDIVWNDLKMPSDFDNITSQYVNIYYKETDSGIIQIKNEISAEDKIKRINKLKSGTIYDVTAKAHYKYIENGNTKSSELSDESNNVKVMTDIDFSVTALESNKLKITWDDVFNGNERIDYDIYISEEAGFENVKPIEIKKEDIGGETVKISENDGKLEYIHSTKNFGKVYYVKILPSSGENSFEYNSNVEKDITNTYILTQTERVSNTDIGVIWKVSWSSVLSGLTDSSLSVNYEILKGNDNDSNLPIYFAETKDTSFYLVVSEEESPETYYIIKAYITKDGENIYSDVDIESKEVYLKEAEIVLTPRVPVIVDDFKEIDTNEIIIDYDEELSSNSASILWESVKDDYGEIDNDITYDIYLYTNPNDLKYRNENPSYQKYKIENDFVPIEENYIYDDARIVGYKYVIESLSPNSTYYFEIIAKKSFTINSLDGAKLENYSSDSAYKIIITPLDNNIDKPKSINAPPIGIKRESYPDGKYLIEKDSVMLSVKNKWYEKYDITKEKWNYFKTDKDYVNEVVNVIPDGGVNNKDYREIDIQSDYSINIICKEFEDGLIIEDVLSEFKDIRNINRITDPNIIKIEDVSLDANDANELASNNIDNIKHNVDVKIENLESNKKYIILMWLYNTRLGEWSEASDSIVITTVADEVNNSEMPIIPKFSKTIPGDLFVDLAWDISEGYKYILKFGTEEDINNVSNTIFLDYEELKDNRYYRIEDLEDDTKYYFWLQSINGNTKSSWSDSFPLKTLSFNSLFQPVNFGIKSEDGSITKNKIAYEWWQTENLVYTLEIADNANYYNKKEFTEINDNTYDVTDLSPNKMYYARLYAIDKERNIMSKPTNDIIIKTSRSNDEYDSDYSNLITDQLYLETVNDLDYSLNLDSIYVDKLIDEISNDDELNFTIPLDIAVDKVNNLKFTFSGKILGVLSDKGEKLILESDLLTMVINPGIFVSKNDKSKWNNKYIINLSKIHKDLVVENRNLINIVSDIMNIETYEKEIGRMEKEIFSFKYPIKIMYPYKEENFYKYGKTHGLQIGETNNWEIKNTNHNYNSDEKTGVIKFDINNPGIFAIGDINYGLKFNDIADSRFYDDIKKVSNNYDFKSVNDDEFRPNDKILIKESIKLLFDIMKVPYEDDYMEIARTSGIIDGSENLEDYCSKEKSIVLIVNALQIIKKEKYQGKYENIEYTDIKSVNSKYLSKVLFAINKNIIYKNGDKLYPKEFITRGEFLYMISKMLEL
ncbi:MAG: S-layer homology domain-containing protein [Clostridiales bacterium]